MSQPLAAGPPTIPDCIEQQIDKRPSPTRAVAARFRQIAVELEQSAPFLARRFDEVAWRLVRCAQAGRKRGPFRCGSNFCPRCARQRAIGFHRRVAAMLYDRTGSGVARNGFALLTLSVSAYNARSGVRRFKSAWKAFFRRGPFRSAFTGGQLHLQPEPARGDSSGQSWNIHAHALVELACPMQEVDLTDLQAAWADVLARLDGRGSLDLRQNANLRPEFFANGKRAFPSRRELRHASKAE